MSKIQVAREKLGEGMVRLADGSVIPKEEATPERLLNVKIPQFVWLANGTGVRTEELTEALFAARERLRQDVDIFEGLKYFAVAEDGRRVNDLLTDLLGDGVGEEEEEPEAGAADEDVHHPR
jgi:hypothetical protein